VVFYPPFHDTQADAGSGALGVGGDLSIGFFLKAKKSQECFEEDAVWGDTL